MAGEDQEQLEDYLELEHFVQELQAGHIAHPPAELTPEQARIYQMAVLFLSAAPDAAEPRPEFAAQLYAHLEREMQQQQEHRPRKSKRLAFLRKKQEQEGQVRSGSRKTARPVSRRTLLAGGAAVAASLFAGAVIEHEIDQGGKGKQNTTASRWEHPLISANQPTTWFFVTTLSELGDKAVRFSTGTIVGYVIHSGSSGSSQSEGQIIAMSAACTHMGCIVQWQESEQTFRCPCHGGLFTENGEPAPRSPLRYLSPLPRLKTKVENGKLYVEVPVSTK